MKTILAALLVATGAIAAAPAPASAESSYWQDRAEGRGYYDNRSYGKPRGDHVDVRLRKRPRGYAAEGHPPRSYNGPVYQSQEQVQQSVYDFATGGSGNINDYR